MSILLHVVSVACILALLVTLGVLAGTIVSALRRIESRLGAWEAVALLLALSAACVLFLRPHEHTFQGLDAAGYRLMAGAMAQGRPLCGVDEPLLGVPEELRPALLYRPLGEMRRTRDKSFQIESLQTGRTKAFFYPLLPLCMLGFDTLVPGDMRDVLVPLVGLLFAFVILAVGFDKRGVPGLVGSGALLLVTPLPAWFFRGCFPEAVGGALVALSLLSWSQAGAGQRGPSRFAFFALGLAVSFHPVFVALSVPMAGLMLLSATGSGRRLAGNVIAFVLGALPLLLMTLTVAAPYGAIHWEVLVAVVRLSAAIRITLVAGLSAVLLFGLALVFRSRLSRVFPLRGIVWRIVWGLTVLVLWILPTALVVRYWGDGPAVWAGLLELGEALRLPGLALCGVGGVALLVWREGRERLASVALLAVLPVFLYLKGWDHLGMWSQRRLLPVVLVGIAVLTPALAEALRFLTSGARLRRTRVGLISLALMGAGATHAARWPAPYLVRLDRGADEWVARVASSMGEGLYVFDYLGHSIPFAVSGRQRVFGLGEHGRAQLGGVSAWMCEQASRESVFWVSAYANPGVEDGVALDDAGVREVRLPRVRCKTALPAESAEAEVKLRFLRVQPVAGAAAPATHKLFDGGPLGLRGPWGRTDIAVMLPDGTRLPAQWSREGSAVIGPVPRPGETVRLTLRGDACRRDDRDSQVLRVAPSWDAAPAELVLTNGFNTAVAEWARPALTNAPAAGNDPRTGLYTFTAAYPYNPRAAGIRGFATDLGALIYDMRIETVSASALAGD